MNLPPAQNDAPTSRIWRGRRLPRPAEDLEDQGLGFDVVTVLNRRAILRGVGLGGLGLALAGCGASGASSSASSSAVSSSASGEEIPDETAGPYPGDGSNGPDVLEDTGIVRGDIRSSFGDADGVADGVPMTLQLALSDLAEGGSPLAGAAVYVWHCDQQGRYSMYSDGVEDENYLRGVQVADEDGIVGFTSIFPACYAGRWPHIHFEVYPDVESIDDAANAIATSQVALPKSTCTQVYATTGYEDSPGNLAQVSLSSDNVFGDDSGAVQLGTVTGTIKEGFAVSLPVRIDTSTTPTTGTGPDAGPDGAPAGAPGGGPGGGSVQE